MTVKKIAILVLLPFIFQEACLAQAKAKITEKNLDICYTENASRADALGVIEVIQEVEEVVVSIWLDTNLGTLNECRKEKVITDYPKNTIRVNDGLFAIGNTINKAPATSFVPKRIIHVASAKHNYILIEVYSPDCDSANKRFAYFAVSLNKENLVENLVHHEFYRNALNNEQLIDLIGAN